MGGKKTPPFSNNSVVRVLVWKNVATPNKVAKLPTQELPPRWQIYRLSIHPAERKGPMTRPLRWQMTYQHKHREEGTD